MSVMIVLLPVAYLGPIVVAAAAAAIKAHEDRATQGTTLNVETRMKDLGLLSKAFESLGYAVTIAGDELNATSESGEISFFKNEAGLWVSQFSPDTNEEDARGILLALDSAYGIQVQKALLEKIQLRASSANLKIVSQETNYDESVTLTLAQATA